MARSKSVPVAKPEAAAAAAPAVAAAAPKPTRGAKAAKPAAASAAKGKKPASSKKEKADAVMQDMNLDGLDAKLLAKLESAKEISRDSLRAIIKACSSGALSLPLSSSARVLCAAGCRV